MDASTSSSASYFSARFQTPTGLGVHAQSDYATAHWSELKSDTSGDSYEEAAAIDNVEVFEALQRHPQWGHFFKWYGGGENEMVMGAKIGEGAQAQVFNAQVTKAGGEPCNMNMVLKKVFNKGTRLRDLQMQWPDGLLQRQMQFDKYMESNCAIHSGTLLSDGRFAFLMSKEHCDLRTLIDRRMRNNSTPFSNGIAAEIMWYIADGMATLHRNNIILRDLKASNVLVNRKYGVACCVADYECALGVYGTGFFRAPEVLQALKDRDMNPGVFTKEGDVYSYGMTCYEILTGKFPFQGHRVGDYDLVLHRREGLSFPHHTDTWIRNLVNRCCAFNPSKRPSFEEICGDLKGRFCTNNNLQEIVELRKKQMW